MENLDNQYLRLFSSFYNRSFLLDFIQKKDSRIKRSIKESNNNTRFIETFGDYTYGEMFDDLYKIIKKDYKCEYIYLNEIFINEILKNHDENHSVLTELYVNKSQADLVVINGTTTIYEIKTELDSLYRLEGQLDDYMMVFDRVYVVTYPDMVTKIDKFLSGKYHGVGICILGSNNEVVYYRKSKSHKRSLNKEAVFGILNRKEFELFDDDYYKAKEKFMRLSNKSAHEYLKTFLYNRSKGTEYLLSLPDSLKMAGYKIVNRLNKKQQVRFIEKLNIIIKEDL